MSSGSRRYQSMFPELSEKRDSSERRLGTVEGRKAVSNAAARGDRDEVKRLLSLPQPGGHDTGFTTNIPRFHKLPNGGEVDSLTYAIMNGDLPMVRKLVEEGAIPIRARSSMDEPLVIAAKNNQLEIIKFLWEASQNDYYRYVREGAANVNDRYPPKGPLGRMATLAISTAANKNYDDIVDYLVTVCGGTIDYDFIRREHFHRIIRKYHPDVLRLFELVLLESDDEEAIRLIKSGVSCDIFFPTDGNVMHGFDLTELGPRITSLGLALCNRQFPRKIITTMIEARANPFKRMSRAVSDPTLRHLYAAAMCCDERPVVLLATLGVQFTAEIVVSILERPRSGRLSGERVRLLTAIHSTGVTISDSIFDQFPSFANELIQIGY